VAPRPPWRAVLAGTAVAALGLTAISPVSAFAVSSGAEPQTPAGGQAPLGPPKAAVSSGAEPQTPAGGQTPLDPPKAAADTDYESENAVISQGVVESNHAGYSGTGFVNFDNVTGSYVEYSVNAAQAGSSWRTMDVAGRPGPADLGAAPGAAAGAGPRDWWAKHGPEITAALGCMLGGAAAAQLFLVGVSGVGGVLAMLGLIEGGLNCFN